MLSRTIIASAFLGAWVAAGSAQANPLQARAHAEQVFAALAKDSPQAVAQWQTGVVGPALITKARFATVGDTPRAQAEQFVSKHAALFGVDAAELVFASENIASEKTVVHFAHRVDGRRVLRRGLTVTLCPSGHVTAVSNNIVPVPGVRKSRIGKADARALALAQFAPGARSAEKSRIETVIVAGPGGAFEAAVVHVAPRRAK